ncbi:MCE family protein [Nocardia bovistercoris]|uniref:MCE family protein n=1 Tax=Nocardia bovistercoris TaxID=2785916 RepID=A0A931I9F8_9NOCA|nr:MCE family protein [Nocardia bovistercoris]MBH0776310.1 MCE family protein [Nocardia bovistercoris]
MSRTPGPAKLSAVIALGAVLAGCSSTLNPMADDTTIIATFSNANGIYPGNVVAVLGMKVGEVVRVQPHGTGVEVELRVNGDIELPAEVEAVTVSDSVLTDRHVELTPVYRGGPRLTKNAVLGPDRTDTPIEFDSLMEMVEKLTGALGGDGFGKGPVADLMSLGTAATAGNGDDMRAALSELSKAMRLGADDGAGMRNAITDVVTNLDALTELAARNDHTVREFGSGIQQLSDLLADQNIGAGTTGATLNRILATVTELLIDNQQTIAELASNSNTVFASVADYQYNVAEFLDVFPLVADNTYNAIDQNVGALRANIDVNRLLLDGQMVKEVCNLLNLTNLGCNTGDMRDMGPDFGITAILQGLAAAR